MSTLLLRLAAPMQAWGSDSRFEHRQRTNKKRGYRTAGSRLGTKQS